MKVLILGVNGFIGNALTHRILTTTDWEVFGLDMACDKLERSLGDPRFHYLEGDITIAQEATFAACRAQGLLVDDYRRIVDSVPALIWLETEMIRETFVGSADPGPYDMISKERPSAALPDPLH